MYRPAVCFTLGEAAATTAYQSKIGGTPYLPKNAEYPYHAEKKHPLTLVAQINFAEVPPLPGFPERGILQVFVDGLDYGLGNDFENLSEQAGWRIMYYPELLPESELQTDFSAYQATDSECLPFSGEFPLIFQAASEEEEDADSINLKGIKSAVLRFFFRATRFLSVMKTLILTIPLPSLVLIGANTSCCCN
jgi:hypothetical protein